MPLREMQYQGPKDWPGIRAWLEKRAAPDPDLEKRVREILDNVEKRRDAALVEYTRRFDCETMTRARLKVSQKKIRASSAKIPKKDLKILEEAAGNIRAFHENQKQRSFWTTQADGTILGQKISPVDRAGLYVPGGQAGKTPLLSSLLMTAVPAITAGVGQIAVVSPPRPDGTLNPYIPAAAAMLGIHEIYACGGPWAVAALAFGTQTIPKVDVVAGPGNIHVTEAKRLLTGRVGIDMIAGPSEIVILADGSTDPEFAAADLLSQAEHDALASAVLVTADKTLSTRIKKVLAAQLKKLPQNKTASKSLADFGAIIVTKTLDQAVELINLMAPEHLELALADPWSTLGRIQNAGAVFVGPHSPEPVGDYFAGPNHVLPTLGTARFSSGLGVSNFCKKTNIIATSKDFVIEHGAKIARLARLEGLEAHARSVEIRMK
ncbi:MAG: histidinol dehydrogenase [Thermodesulfobacteriota bacterium]|nr:histidinol dehydrogenase [Thermodesulfobacteriota bacterium]